MYYTEIKPENVVYKITCNKCHSPVQSRYTGETYRPLEERFMEHWRSANNPNAKSYKDKPLAKHYRSDHKGEKPDLSLDILYKCSNIKDRKVKEARTILSLKPELNDKNEQLELLQFLV